MWITFMYGEMDRDGWQSQSIWMQGFMYSKVLSGLLIEIFIVFQIRRLKIPMSASCMLQLTTLFTDTMCKICIIGGMH